MAVQMRINDLDVVVDAEIDATTNLPLDLPSQTFKMSLGQLASYNKATQAEVDAGTIPDKFVTPKTLKPQIDAVNADVDEKLTGYFPTNQALGTVDLDTITDDGLYYQNKNTNTAGNNYPKDVAGTLEIISSRAGGAFTQTYTPYKSNAIYTRYTTNGTSFSDWVLFSNDDVVIAKIPNATPAVRGILETATEGEAAGGLLGDKIMTPIRVKEVINKAISDALAVQNELQNPIGTQLIGGTNPATRGIPGTWEALEADVSIISADEGDAKIGTIDGDNDPAAVIPLTPITATARSTFTGTAMGEHEHTIKSYAGEGHDSNNNARHADGNGTQATSGVSAGTPAGSVATTVTVHSIGVEGATNNVRGRNSHRVIWERTA
jgi:hypothetical protein